MPTEQVQKKREERTHDSQQGYEQQNHRQQNHQQMPRNEQVRDHRLDEFWTEEIGLVETIPAEEQKLIEGKDTFEVMDDAYEKVHETRMGYKDRTWRTERTTKKKHERTFQVKKGVARYEHNLDYMKKKYDLRTRLAGKSFFEQDKITKWLDLSGTAEGEQFNQVLMSRFSGDEAQENAQMLEILGIFDRWDLNAYSNPDDEMISKNYYDLHDKVEKADAAGFMLSTLQKRGVQLDAKYVERLRGKIEFFRDLKQVLDQKERLIKNRYYSLLRKSDIDSIGIDEVKRRQMVMITDHKKYEAAFVDYYSVIISLHQLKSVREKLKDPSSYYRA